MLYSSFPLPTYMQNGSANLVLASVFWLNVLVRAFSNLGLQQSKHCLFLRAYWADFVGRFYPGNPRDKEVTQIAFSNLLKNQVECCQFCGFVLLLVAN